MRKNFVGVVAQKSWQAIQAADKLKVTWTPGTGLPSHRDFYEYLRNQKLDSRDTFLPDVPQDQQNNFGFALGGPVVIPHVYDGRGNACNC